MSPTFDFAVIGAGLLGSATAYQLAGNDRRVALIGPAEPVTDSLEALYGAHYDQGRLFHRLGRDISWSVLAERSLATLTRIALPDGAPLLNQSGMVLARPAREEKAVAAYLATVMEETAARFALSPAWAWMKKNAYYRFSPDDIVVTESAPAGHFNPRQLVNWQITTAINKGVKVWRDAVVALQDKGDNWHVVTRGGRAFSVRKVVVAAGAYSNWPGLLPEPLDLTLEQEYVLLAEVSAQTAVAWQDLPTLIYHPDDWDVADIYAVPPLRYPNGRYFLKLGANTKFDRQLHTIDETNAWYRDGASDVALPSLRDALNRLMPDLPVIYWQTTRCVITRTRHGLPYIDAVRPGRLYVAVGGNGTAAKAAPAIGALAATLAIDDRWSDSLPSDDFRAVYAAKRRSLIQ